MGVACLIWPIVMIGARERGIRGSRGTLPPTSSPCACALGTFMLEELPPLEKTAAKGRGKYMSADLDRPVFGGRIPTRWYLAIALQISSTITAMGAGMTVKFFPLFFRIFFFARSFTCFRKFGVLSTWDLFYLSQWVAGIKKTWH